MQHEETAVNRRWGAVSQPVQREEQAGKRRPEELRRSKDDVVGAIQFEKAVIITEKRKIQQRQEGHEPKSRRRKEESSSFLSDQLQSITRARCHCSNARNHQRDEY